MRTIFLLLAATLNLPAFAQAPAASAAPKIAVKPVAEVAIYPQREATAQAVSLNESRIAAEIPGRIEAIPVRVGERVARGAVLARLDCRDYELERKRASAADEAARARRALAEQQRPRARELGARGFFSEEALALRDSELKVQRATSEQARAQLASATRAISKCTIHSPFAAIVRDRLGQVGELAAPGSPLVAISDALSVEVSAQVPLDDVKSLSKANKLRFVGDGGTRELALLRISPAIAPRARLVEARLRFKHEPAAAGASGSLIWQDTRPYAPPELVVRRDGRLGVFVAEQGRARFHPLADAQEGRPALLDLGPGVGIVVSGQLALRDGQPLTATGK